MGLDVHTHSEVESKRQDQPQPLTTGIGFDQLGLTVKPISTEHCVRIGQEAWSRLTRCQVWTDWLLVGEALDAGRIEAMRSAHVNRPKGGRYNQDFGDWLKANHFDGIHKTTRSQLFKCLEHRKEIETWRAVLTTDQQQKLNHPVAVLRRWQKAIAKKPDDAEPKRSPIAKLKESIFTLEEENTRLKREVERGAPFTPSDKPTDQAAVVFRMVHCSPSAARALSRALNKLARAAEAQAPQTTNKVQA
jgi:hypothetical protein